MSDVMQAVVIGGGIGLVVAIVNIVRFQRKQALLKEQGQSPRLGGGEGGSA